VLNYRYENGRRYHAYRDGQYILPNDDAEKNRLDMLHHIYRLVIGGQLYRAPLNQPQRVLDLGTGTGKWAIEMADDHPQAIVQGTDLSPIQDEWVPPNCKFYVDDYESEWTYPPSEHFDYIHGRALCGSIGNFPYLFSQVLQNLKPGGWFEMQEYHCQVYSDDDSLDKAVWLKDWVEQMNEASKQFGKVLKTANLIKGYMIDAGFVDIHEEIYKCPIGRWAKGKRYKELGMYYRAQFYDAVEPFTLALYTRVLGYSVEQAWAVIAKVKEDLVNPKLHLYVNYHFVWGQRPG
jgi:SAM-dependent methyltransferase